MGIKEAFRPRRCSSVDETWISGNRFVNSWVNVNRAPLINFLGPFSSNAMQVL